MASAAAVSYDGHGDGHDRDAAFCERGGQLTGGADIDAGTLELVVADGDGDTVFRATYEEGFDLTGRTLEGKEGDWVVTVERGEDFSGQYAFNLFCS